MKVWKLVSGILSIVLFFVVMLQSCAAGLLYTLEATGESGGTAGVIVGLMMLSGGIVSIAARKGSKGGNIALIVLFGIATLVGFALAGNYVDLNIWAGWCAINVVFAIISLIKGNKKEVETEN